MSTIAQLDQQLEQLIREIARRIAIPRLSEFETVWEAAIRVCDRYELGRNKCSTPITEQRDENHGVTSSEELSAADEPVQTHPPIAA
jgi:hypothetical protein